MSKANQIRTARKARANKKATLEARARNKIQKSYSRKPMRISKQELKQIQKKKYPEPPREPEILSIYDWAIATGRRKPALFQVLSGPMKGGVYPLHPRWGAAADGNGRRYLPLEVGAPYGFFICEDDLEQVQ